MHHIAQVIRDAMIWFIWLDWVRRITEIGIFFIFTSMFWSVLAGVIASDEDRLGAMMIPFLISIVFGVIGLGYLAIYFLLGLV